MYYAHNTFFSIAYFRETNEGELTLQYSGDFNMTPRL